MLGHPSIVKDKKVYFVSVTRPFLLASYLAIKADWVHRDEVLALFWPDSSEAKARQSLRTLIYKVKQTPYVSQFVFEANHMRWLGLSDTSEFQDAISKGEWQKAINNYQGTFLESVKKDESSAFEAWLEQTRDELYAAWRGAVLQLAARQEESELFEIIGLLHKVLNYDFLAEEVVQACMRAEALAGQTDAALKTFENFKAKLELELELEPLKTTLELAEAIRLGEGQKPKFDRAKSFKAYQRDTSQSLGTFIGRTLELLELGNLLAHPQHRLITLLGSGGMGKTRLALKLMSEQAAKYADGVTFVSLAPLRLAQDIPDAVASSLGLERSGTSSVANEVINYLQNKQMLVVLDNFEHVIEGTGFVVQLLEQVPNCNYLVTSRVVLAVANEVIYDVSGLSVPASAKDSDLEAYDAAQLFLRTARRVRSNFSLTKADYPALFELCQILDGMPLALELAANWVRLFNLPDLLIEIKQDIDLLETTGQEVSERHQSLRKVFEYSWQRLSLEEQRSLKALAVFRGGFNREAASTIFQVSAKTLLALVNKSLVKPDSSGRFFVLEVIRQYAVEKLAEDLPRYQELHGRYYLSLLAGSIEELKGIAPKTVLSYLEQDLENIRLAWRWALQVHHFDLCLPVLEPLSMFLMATARLQEGIAFYKKALLSLQGSNEPTLLAKLHLELAYFFRRLDHYQESSNHAAKALRTAQGFSYLQETMIKSLCELAHIRARLGNFEESLGYAEQAMKLAQQSQNLELIAACRSRLALAKRYLGNFADAQDLYEQALLFERQRGNPISMLRTLSDLGRLYNDINRPREARELFQEGLELAQSQNLPYELGFMWEGLSRCSLLLGEYENAQKEAQLAISRSEEVNDIIGVAVQCSNLAQILLALNKVKMAEGYLKRALDLSWNNQEIPEILKILLIWATIFAIRQMPDKAAELLAHVAENPASEFVDKQQARAHLQDTLVALDQVTRKSLEATVTSLLRST